MGDMLNTNSFLSIPKVCFAPWCFDLRAMCLHNGISGSTGGRVSVIPTLKVGKAEVKAGKRPDVISSAKFNDSAGTSGASDLGNVSFTELKGVMIFLLCVSLCPCLYGSTQE